MRKYFIDNVRWLAVLFLFPYHTARIFDSLMPFYIKGTETEIANTIVLAATPWFMPLLFVVAGMSTRYALQKRSNLAYVKERFLKLFVPLLSGILLLIPLQTYYAEIFHNGYTGSYWKQYIFFFTKETDLTGYTGGFTPGQLWFICYLFVISLIALPIFQFARKKEVCWRGANILVIPMCILTFVLSYVLDIGGKSIGEYFSLFVLGYFVLAEEKVQEFLDKYRMAFLAVGAGFTVYTVVFQTLAQSGVVARAISIVTSWMDVLAILGLGRHYLNFQNKWTKYLSKASFACYLFHQSLLIFIGFYVLQSGLSFGVQYIIILVGSFWGSIFLYEVCRRVPLFRFLFAIKKG